FGISLVAFASTFLSTVVVFERTADSTAPRHGPALGSVSRRLRWAVLGTSVYVLGVVYLGAFMRHTGVSLACADWPLCNGQVVPPLEGPTGIAFAHRLAALGAVVLVGFLSARTRSIAGIGPIALGAFALVVLQALSGALV